MTTMTDTAAKTEYFCRISGLYIHVPFCAGKCPYCDFYSVVPSRNQPSLPDDYTRALIKELDLQSAKAFETVYFGGGTPSRLGEERLAEILRHIPKINGAEVTVEINPSDAGREDRDFDFRLLAANGVNRISMGLQSAVDSERKALGRRSGKTEIERAIKRANEAGIENISLDLMLGIPGQTPSSLDESIDFCVHSGAKHISVYMLTIEEGTRFYAMRDKLSLPGEDEACDMYLQAVSRLEESGFRQYEISNFALPGFESRHNLRYWQCKEYTGIGAGAHSFENGRRFYYPKDIDKYISAFSYDGKIKKRGCEIITDPGKEIRVDDGEGGGREERIMLALRLTEGIGFADYEKRYGEKLPDDFMRLAKKLADEGLAVLTDTAFSLTARGFLVSNTIIGELTALLGEK